MSTPAVVLFEHNLRIADNLALRQALETKLPILPVFVYKPKQYGAASRWWLHHSLKSLEKQLHHHGLRLHIARKKPEISGAKFFSDAPSLLFSPDALRNLKGEPYKVFTPFYNTLIKRQDEIAEPLAKLRGKIAGHEIKSESIDDLELLPKIAWAKGFAEHWHPGEEGAHKALDHFLKKAVTHYREGRDDPSYAGTSRLSPHLHFGEISPQQIWATVKAHAHGRRLSDNESFFLRELAWREFSYHLLAHFPHTTHEPLRPEFKKFPWKKNSKLLKAWQRGLTGYPIVDAGMRELWQTGWMHNRVRMIVGSFLIKDLLQPWQDGADWFLDTLVDADMANNTMGWQWVAGSGADASPFFRVFNPILQGEKFDPEGRYVKRYVPELAALPKKYLHRPFDADSETLKKAGLKLGVDYPLPLVDHGQARDEALRIFKTLK